MNLMVMFFFSHQHKFNDFSLFKISPCRKKEKKGKTFPTFSPYCNIFFHL